MGVIILTHFNHTQVDMKLSRKIHGCYNMTQQMVKMFLTLSTKLRNKNRQIKEVCKAQPHQRCYCHLVSMTVLQKNKKENINK